MKIVDKIIYKNAKEKYKIGYEPLVNHAFSYMLSCKQIHVLASTYFSDPKSTAEEIQSQIFYGVTIGSYNYLKYAKSDFYEKYLHSTITNQIRKYMSERIKWESKHTLVDFTDPNLDVGIIGVESELIASELDINDFSFIGLSKNEIRAVIYYTYGFSDSYVSDVLGISKNTIKTFRRRGIAKMKKQNDEQKLRDLSEQRGFPF